MRIHVKKDVESIRALFKANVPTFVIEQIIGRDFDSDDNLNITVPWLGQPTTWCLPASAVTVLTDQVLST